MRVMKFDNRQYEPTHTERVGKSVGLDVTGEDVGDFVVGLLVGCCMMIWVLLFNKDKVRKATR